MKKLNLVILLLIIVIINLLGCLDENKEKAKNEIKGNYQSVPSISDKVHKLREKGHEIKEVMHEIRRRYN